MKKGEVRQDEPLRVRGAAQRLGVERDHERAGVVVHAVAAGAGGDAERRVLNDAGVVRQAQQVIEAQLGQAARARLLAATARAGAPPLQRLPEPQVLPADLATR